MMPASGQKTKREGAKSLQIEHEQLIVQSQESIQQSKDHLQTILILTHFHCNLYQIDNRITNSLSPVQDKYFRKKRRAFEKIKNWKYFSQLFSIKKLSKENLNCKHILTHQVNRQQLCFKISQKAISVLKKIVNILSNKQKGYKSYSFLKMEHYSGQQLSNMKFHSQKSSKIQTSDTKKKLKRKQNKPTIELSSSRKSFSLEKPITSLKYSVSPKNIPSATKNLLSLFEPRARYINSPFLNESIGRNRTPTRSQLQISSSKYISKGARLQKSNSSKKINVTLVDEKEQKKDELEYLKKKYSKLIIQFNWFSERFYQVIEEEEAQYT